MRFLVISAAAAVVLGLAAASPALAHEGGHQGGCEDFGHVNYDWAHNPEAVVAAIEAALGIDMPDAHNLGGIVSFFAQDPDSWPGVTPGVGDIVEISDHAACGPG